MATKFVGEPFEVTIADGCARFEFPCGKTPLVIPLRVFRIMHERSAAALAEHDGHSAEVVPLRKG